MLRPELEQVEGFVDNIRYKSLIREGWILSLSNWRNEKSLVRWRTRIRHHEVQQKGRDEILADYHLRVGQITADNQIPAGYALTEQRLDETEVGEGTTVTLINATCPAEWKETNNPYDCAEWLGLDPWAADCTSWDIFDAVLTPGDLILLISWKDATAAQAYEDASAPNDKARVRRVRIVRDYGKYDRREAPQYYADAKGGEPSTPDTTPSGRAGLLRVRLCVRPASHSCVRPRSPAAPPPCCQAGSLGIMAACMDVVVPYMHERNAVRPANRRLTSSSCRAIARQDAGARSGRPSGRSRHLVPRAVTACRLWPLRRRCAFGERRHRRGPHLGP